MPTPLGAGCEASFVMKLAVCAVIIGIAVAAAEPIVLEYRKVIETRVQADTYIALRRKVAA